jgi:hypothetical protein
MADHLARLGSPTKEHCERHRVTANGNSLLFIRTMSTVTAGETEQERVPACAWEIFDVDVDAGAVHVGSLHDCRFRIAGGCAYGIDGPPDEPEVPVWCED